MTEKAHLTKHFDKEAEMSNTGITWLHLSDLHEGTPHVKADKEKVLNGLIADIKHRTEISNDLNQVDFIIFSGDVAFAGKPEKYKSAQEFFDRVLEAAGLKGRT
ncbi:MAG: metallophosphoesterase, partial [Kovacikia sp.]